ncbi:hydroxymethylglutaryl-CoA synthase [Actinocorallia sp. A-T 12471]|uniref:hydroxymethylglutaryl-CoA synthase n=1 Tax=Actinocorallia sp. A-T 12471 TaxID=3089813 RepID=UPI0029CF68AB|nr:hydroxymethylglutaryl-CoA synthase [Actinocorallia sp. A-T 12471]MDX6739449.1 hydroxymethylglutaryl-CoA synthase [Actinocorallia sp. A-T 12471]
MAGGSITAYAVHLPAFALSTTDFRADGAPGRGRTRSVASHDEDAVTLGVEAGRRLDGALHGTASLLLATSEPPYLDKSSAATVHAALALPDAVAALDLTGLRSGAAALRTALAGGGLAVLADHRTDPPGAPGELAQGDGAAAFAAGEDGPIRLLATASATVELLDRWRAPGAPHPTVWDERFTAGILRDRALDAVTRALKDAGLERVDHVVVSCANPRAAAALRSALGGGRDAEVEARIGYCGAAHLGVLLADAFDRARPGETVLAVNAADGADAFVFEVADGIEDAGHGPAVRDQLDARTHLTYERYVRWRGLFTVRGPNRPEPAPPAAPPMERRRAWKNALVAARCTKCAAVTAPPGRVCAGCGAHDALRPESLRDLPCTIVSLTEDLLAVGPDGPSVQAVVDVEGGGRRSVHVADVPEGGLAVGDVLWPVFRRISSSGGVHNYFWKARPMGKVRHG